MRAVRIVFVVYVVSIAVGLGLAFVTGLLGR
ncbi:hypothetical protein FHW15_001521 [Terracoccus luteus]|uniref:Uncharacterized protein n=1 Tax=Terracoccus luteus TaxID=53356 RepID=A0A839PWL8_9MICO|nr:hypothetical protein [Terracoccus luteus]MCP2172024.1 hypothetical protein [Terracoccus luteus]